MKIVLFIYNAVFNTRYVQLGHGGLNPDITHANFLCYDLFLMSLGLVITVNCLKLSYVPRQKAPQCSRVEYIGQSV